jgi:hypothetical protein
MNLQEQERERAADQWLEEVIGYLRDAGPRAGLETRVLAGLRAHVEQRRRRWTLVAATSAAAVLVAGLVASWPRSKPEPAPNVVQKALPARIDDPAPVIVVADRPQGRNGPRAGARRILAAASPVPRSGKLTVGEVKQEIFPSPAPLTEQGRLLQAYLRQTPPRELALIAARQGSLSSLEIKDLNIAPIEIADLTPKTDAEKHQD